jgi:cobalt-zinc-cadmium resistance protein CzcA
MVAGPKGAEYLYLKLATCLVEAPAQISRDDTRRRISVEVNVRGRDIGSFVKEAQDVIDKQIKIPPGYYVTWDGQFENLQRATQRLLIVVPLALFLIFVLLLSTFRSVKQSVLIYTGIPSALCLSASSLRIGTRTP